MGLVRSIPEETIHIDGKKEYLCIFSDWMGIISKPDGKKYCSERCKIYEVDARDPPFCIHELLMGIDGRNREICKHPSLVRE